MRLILLVSLSLLLPCRLAWAGDKGKTPEEAFKAMQAAHDKGGPKAFLPYLTKDSQKALAGGMVVTIAGVRAMLAAKKGTLKETIESFDAFLKKHGVDLAKLKGRDKPPASADAAVAALIEAGSLPKEPAAFVEDAVTVLNELSGTVKPLELVPDDAVLKNVKITSDTAKGTMHYRLGDEDKSDPIFFRREAGLWRIDFIPNIRAPFSKK
ncbi:MAG: hypothetical protein U0793_08090 [Gemmataceae bacterium]